MGEHEPRIFGYESGYCNSNMNITLERLNRSAVYKDQSTICIIPALNTVATKAASSWLNLMKPPNQKFVNLFTSNLEVGEAYSQTIESILVHPELSKFKYILTMESDNTCPPDGLIKLLERMELMPEMSAIGGLYHTKGGESSVPQIWGDIHDSVMNFRPIPPVPGEFVECCGIANGFSLFRLDMFKDERLRRPWFKTTCSLTEGCYSQDLYFFSDARKYGYRCGIDCSVLCGHIDMQTGFVW